MNEREDAIYTTLAASFEQPVDSMDHGILRDTAWMGGDLVEGPYLLGMIEGENLFKFSREEYIRRLHSFVANRVSPTMANILARPAECQHLTPFLRRVYHTETRHPSMPSRNDRQETVIDYVLRCPHATDADVADAVGTTRCQIARISELTAIRKAIRLYEDACRE